jgi:hypothetical protein
MKIHEVREWLESAGWTIDQYGHAKTSDMRIQLKRKVARLEVGDSRGRRRITSAFYGKIDNIGDRLVMTGIAVGHADSNPLLVRLKAGKHRDNTPIMDPEDPKTWNVRGYCGTTIRVYHKLVDTDFGPEMLVKVWSSVSRKVMISQEAMAVNQQVGNLMEGETAL